MKLNELKSADGARIPNYRKGRGVGSGNGKTSGRGQKGQGARSGGASAPGFEGGQMPLYRRLPKRGFKHISRKEYAIVNVSELNVFKDGTLVNSALLISKGLVKKEYDGVKILGNGELSKKLTVEANKFSKSAADAIAKAGGEIKVI